MCDSLSLLRSHSFDMKYNEHMILLVRDRNSMLNSSRVWMSKRERAVAVSSAPIAATSKQFFFCFCIVSELPTSIFYIYTIPVLALALPHTIFCAIVEWKEKTLFAAAPHSTLLTTGETWNKNVVQKQKKTNIRRRKSWKGEKSVAHIVCSTLLAAQTARKHKKCSI